MAAQVTFEPESFLGDEIKTAVGTTNMNGDAAIESAQDQFRIRSFRAAYTWVFIRCGYQKLTTARKSFRHNTIRIRLLDKKWHTTILP